MTRYLGTAGVAALTGLAYNTVTAYRSRGKLPTPDAIVEEGGTETWGWFPETIECWMRERTLGRPGRKPPVRWLEDEGNGDIVILTDVMQAEELTGWLFGSCPDFVDPTDLARYILSRSNPGPVGHDLEIRSCKQRAVVPSGVTRRDLRRLAHAVHVTCWDADSSQIATVLAHARPEAYDELIRAYTQA